VFPLQTPYRELLPQRDLFLCLICNKEVCLEHASSNQEGKIVHESCYVQELTATTSPPPDQAKPA
jgi:hypothetical protein